MKYYFHFSICDVHVSQPLRWISGPCLKVLWVYSEKQNLPSTFLHLTANSFPCVPCSNVPDCLPCSYSHHWHSITQQSEHLVFEMKRESSEADDVRFTLDDEGWDISAGWAGL